LCPDALLIFLTAASNEEWLQRLIDRRSETPDELQLRIETAEKEYALIEQFDYLVVNSQNHLEKTICDIQAIIQTEHMRTKPRKVDL
jgi:guanylate kinase